jgi:glycosyltransferase involved in cell wall biosynthesis
MTMIKPPSFTLIICTYMRPMALSRLLSSVVAQSLQPREILIIDGSLDDATRQVCADSKIEILDYFQVDAQHRGLTKQRNFGITQVADDIDIVCFLDDDVILEPDYFEQLLSTYTEKPDALAVGGYITNEVQWQQSDTKSNIRKFCLDGYCRPEPLRFRVRHWFGLAPDRPPCFLPTFSHGRSVSFLPPSGQIYEVEHFMGGVSSYKMELFRALSFSSYFEGYGLYEDADFCFRIRPLGALYVNTKARLEHHHEPLGRPNALGYGKMVVRNGRYVWRVRYPKPTFKAKIKWHATALLLMALTCFSGIQSSQNRFLIREAIGRFLGWFSVMFNPPKPKL